MKKIRLLVLIMIASLSNTFAQKIAVLDFKAGTGVSQNYADSITSVFIKHFRIGDAEILASSQLKKQLINNGFEENGFTDEEKMNLTEILNSNKIISGVVEFANEMYAVRVSAFDIKWKTDMIRDSLMSANRLDCYEETKDLAKQFGTKVNEGSLMIDLMMKTLTITPLISSLLY
ncbi:MAG: hypothetical protein IJQ11_02685 [Bacteroidales bacterium]|nr:hypothetical protein [Bacteroidales bacterium]